MKVKMLKTEKGSPNGIRVIEYIKGEEYEMPEKLADVFISIGCAEPKMKSVKQSPKNKIMQTPKDKSDELLPEDKQKDELSKPEDEAQVPKKSKRRQRKK